MAYHAVLVNPYCGTGGRWFEPTQLYQSDQQLSLKSKIFEIRLAKTLANVQAYALSTESRAIPKTARPSFLWCLSDAISFRRVRFSDEPLQALDPIIGLSYVLQ
jgi:hypothetical protein